MVGTYGEDMVDEWSDLTIYLGKAGATPEQLLRNRSSLTHVPLDPGSGIDGDLYFLPTDDDPDPPAWVPPLRALSSSVPPVISVNPGAILTFLAAGRRFAVSFGGGHHRLADEFLETDFGLRIAGNWLSPEEVIGIDSRAVEQTVFLTRRHASTGTTLGTLGLESDRETVQSLTGRPRDRSRGRRVTGRVGVHITRPVAPTDLPALAAELLGAYAGRDYEAAFPAIERRRMVTDQAIVDELDQRMLAGLRSPDRGGAYLAPPELVDWANVAGFRMRGDAAGTRRAEIDLADYLDVAEIDRLPDDEALQVLKDDPISLIARDTGRGPRWSVYKCLIAERETPDGTFVLSDGRWWRIHPSFIGWIDAVLSSVPESAVELPAYLITDVDEGAYNRRAGAAVPGSKSLDRDLARFDGENGTVELCDLVGPGRRLIHVKRGIRSSNLSHLFAQALGSAEVLRHMPAARIQLRSKALPELADVAALVRDDTMAAHDWEVVIAIVAPIDRVPMKLPFFSRAHMARTVRDIKRLDYKVTYRAIEPPA